MSNIGSRLFLSCDLVGSTSHKQSAGKTDIWIPDFLRFYYDFPARVRENLDRPEIAARLAFWKAIGDELLFTIDIKHESEVFYVVTAWVAAMAQYEAELIAKNSEENSAKNKMKMKGGAFIATFPHPDYVVVVPTFPMELDSERDVVVRNEAMKRDDRSEDGPQLIDYLGPSIDTGFRVTATCTQRYFTLSLEVAWAMSYHRLHHDRENTMPGLLLLAETQMKGVWNGREYPVFALDRQIEDKIVASLRAVHNKPEVPLLEVDHLALACLEAGGWPSRVYFEESSYEAFTELGDHLAEQQATLDGMADNSGETLAEFTTDDAGTVESSTEDSRDSLKVPEPRD
ncbi:hypothetical protein ACTXG5_11105 [Mycobacterium sp. Dal123C01]|uniref:hypothetical protein n=1 Tax=Mycobacterium sp. Dal123C01 TaxID=3457577 RepID=UPI00403EAAEF